ncbi:MAG TPA: type II secretion system secretin GspD [Hyphomonadaceae bacterium]|nr:type II secretion system secretin GspD [Hyphomonadaceae bacterium]
MKRAVRLALALMCSASSVQFFQNNEAVAQQTGNGAVSLREVDIRAFIEDVANVTGRTFVIDPRVAGKVTVIATEALSQKELFDVFQATLRVNGFVATPMSSGAYRIVPDEVAARDATAAGGQDGDRYVIDVIPLSHADAENVAAAIRPVLSARGSATTIRRGNSLVVVDFGSTVMRLRTIIKNLDRDPTELRSVRLTNSSAAEMARALQAVLTTEGQAQLQVVPIPSSNTIVLRGENSALNRYAGLLQELDVQATTRRDVVVLPLKFAVADEVLPILQQISASMEGPATTGADGAPAAGRRANIATHKATNSLIISAEPALQEALSDVVRSLDTRRQQVLVEAVIVEVSDAATKELGLQFLVAGNGDNAVPFMSTSYANTAPNLLAVTGALLLPGQASGENANPALADLQSAAVESLLGVSGGLFGVGGKTSNGTILGLIVNALKQDRDSNVLSTPSVMTLDNEKASILVGQQIPVTTGEALGSNNQNPFRTINREDVGVQLEVTPQISAGGAIRLSIRQEVSSIFGPVTTTSTDLITNRREINTVVQVDAGQIIVLGGLIQEDVQKSKDGIPGLRDIPVVGGLFGSESTSRRRTNLMVFLRPTVVSSPEQAREATMRQYQAVQGFDGLDMAIRERVEREFLQTLSSPPVAEVQTAPPAPAPNTASSSQP